VGDLRGRSVIAAAQTPPTFAPAKSPASADRHFVDQADVVPSFHYPQRSHSRGTLHQEPRRHAGWWRARPVVISTRVDAPGCNIVQPNFAAAVSAGNISFRIPTPTFGAGLVETIPDGNLKTASANISGSQASLGIASGAFNTTGNDGTITRFGWKAQNKSLLIFSGEAYNVEQGVTNEAFPNERDDTLGCRFNATPEDATHLTDPEPSNSPASDRPTS
jgi:di-heme oxidoreductase (putative peroxidase)